MRPYFFSCRKLPIQEFYFSRILQEMNLSHQQFIDLCILLGCDYCGTIKGIGPKRAIDLIRQHGSIEEILDNIDQSVSSHTLTNTSTIRDVWVPEQEVIYFCFYEFKGTKILANK